MSTGLITFDIVEADSATMSTWKIVGFLPDAIEEDGNTAALVVRIVDGSTIVSRSVDDEIIVQGRGFAKTMTVLAEKFGTPVVVAKDFGVKHGAKMTGVYGQDQALTETEAVLLEDAAPSEVAGFVEWAARADVDRLMARIRDLGCSQCGDPDPWDTPCRPRVKGFNRRKPSCVRRGWKR